MSPLSERQREGTRAQRPPGRSGTGADRPGGRECWNVRSLECDGRAGLLELGLGGLGGLLVGTLENRLGGGLDEVLGLLEAQAGDDLADRLDHADLLVPGRLEDDV